MAAHGHWWQEDANAIFRFLKFLFWGTAEIVMASYYYHSFLFKKKIYHSLSIVGVCATHGQTSHKLCLVHSLCCFYMQ
jgi:hypothetical protein